MDGFGDSFVPPVDGAATNDVDPAAEFLAREQDQLAGLDDDLIPAAPAAGGEPVAAPPPAGEQPADLDGEADFFVGGADPSAVNGGPELESFEVLGGDEVAKAPATEAASSSPPTSTVPPLAPSGEDPWAGGQSTAPSQEAFALPPGQDGEGFGFAEPPPAQGDGLFEPAFSSDPAGEVAGVAAASAAAPSPPVGDYSAFSNDFGGSAAPAGDASAPSTGVFSGLGDPERQDSPAPPEPARSPVPTIPREEPEKIKIWREEQRVRLEQKDIAEEENKDELREKAKKELEDWYKQHEEQVAKTRQANRSAEKELVADTAKMEPGTEWERIAKLCDFNPKTAKSSRDISRMRSIILQVKQNPPIKA